MERRIDPDTSRMLSEKKQSMVGHQFLTVILNLF